MEFSLDKLHEASNELVAAVYRTIRQTDGRYRCEDAVSAAAAFLGEATMRHAGDFDFDNHTLTPGQPVLSLKVTQILSGDLADYEKMPDRTVFRAFYLLLTNHPTQPWPRESFPDVAGIYRRYAMSRQGGVSPKDWGKAPLSVPPVHYPAERMPPLRAAFELRRFVYTRWRKESLATDSAVSMAEVCLLFVMAQMRTLIAPDIGLLLAFETINAMAKTAPVLPKHIEEYGRKLGILAPNATYS